jgi:hypothetical protein
MAFEYPGGMTSVIDLIKYADGLLGGFFGVGLLIVIGVVAFISSKSYSSEKALGFAGFLTLLSAIILRFMVLIDDIVLYFVVVMFVGIIIWMSVSRNQEIGM